MPSADTPGSTPEVGDEPKVEPDRVPNGGYAWVIAACILASSAVTLLLGVRNNTTYGVFTAYYLEDNYFNASIHDYAWIGGLSVAVALSLAPLANWLTQVSNYRVALLIGATCVVLGQCMAGLCTSFAPFLVCQGVVFGAGLGFVLVPSQPLLSHWFDTRLSLAQGVAAAGSGLGGLVLANTTRAILEHPRLGVKWALIINGGISGMVLFPFHCLATEPTQGLSPLAYFIALYSLASFATSALNLSQTQGAALQSILAAGQMFGRPAWGWLLDKGGRLNMTIRCYLLCGLSTLCIWLPARSFAVLAVFAFIQGVTGGTVWAASTPIGALIVGVKDLQSAMSIFWLVLVIPALTGQPIAIALLEYSRNKLGRDGPEAYYISIGFCGGVAVFSAALLYGAKRHVQQGSWKVWQKT
ncbi:UM00103-like protein [Dioszegia hungarica]|uniref:UM00103-like protein n=1 Tax=Dioszegia hungarica TaxID=4972 RepID=A0AA38LSV4_9TREE|nr:UM00103-like protein [Dioszegia hungarica]KAI9636267.1 UM00103-like protein [Dioszegia hungarica]